jgi:NAD(P)-dependent dehydrogenase (short-subunit alcohol dehydrogenase family)
VRARSAAAASAIVPTPLAPSARRPLTRSSDVQPEVVMDLGMKDKVALITGGSVGIGLEVARAFAREGVHLALCARDGARLAAVASQIADEHGVEVLAMPADVAVAEDIERFCDTIDARFGGVDVLVSNAGTGSAETFLGAPDEKWQHYWDLHVMAAIRLARRLQPGMTARGGGAIIHNASICATQPLYYEPIYNVTKAALAMASKCMAHEFIPYGIRVNTINLGLILTPDWVETAKKLTEDGSKTWEEYLAAIADEATPIGRFATPEEIAPFFVFLASPLASYCVGSSYYVDGGWLRVVN